MDHTYVEEKGIRTLEDYAVFLTSGLLSLMTLHNIQLRAVKIGILKEDMNERANTIIWDCRRQMALYKKQLEEVLDLLPADFNGTTILEHLKQMELKRAKMISRKKKTTA